VVRLDVNGQPFFDAKWRRGGRQVKRRIGPAWLDPGPDGGWVPRRGRVPDGWFDHKRATVRMAELVDEHEGAEAAVERGERDRREHGATVRELAAEWLHYVEHEKRAKPGTLVDYRYYLSEPGRAHKRGKGHSAGLISRRSAIAGSGRSRRGTSRCSSAASTGRG